MTRRAIPPFFKALNRVGIVLFGLTLPAAAQEQVNGAAGLCQSMGPEAVMAISGGVLFGVVLILGLIYWRLQHGGWSLATAASEPTTLRIPLDENWAQSLGDKKSLLGASAPKGPVVSLTVMEASSSRLIALAGMVAILFIYVGFGIFSLYTYGLTCQMPASAVAVTTFLYSGLTLFAPYVANKVSGLLQPLRQGQPMPSEPLPAPPVESLASPLPQPLPQLPAVSSAAHAEAAVVSRVATRSVGVTPPHRIASPTVKAAVALVEPAPARVVSSPTSTEAASYGAAVQLIAQFEGFVGHAYPDLASGGEPWTIGYGFTSLDGRPVQPGDTISQAEGQAQLLSGVNGCARHLASKIPYWGSMAEDQRCALISFAWNLGEDFYGSDGFETISRQLREKDWSGVPSGLLLYCDPGTAVSDG
ncbi:MAG: lysozyme, partial [Cyanobacteriota bacterium]